MNKSIRCVWFDRFLTMDDYHFPNNKYVEDKTYHIFCRERALFKNFETWGSVINVVFTLSALIMCDVFGPSKTHYHLRVKSESWALTFFGEVVRMPRQNSCFKPIKYQKFSVILLWSGFRVNREELVAVLVRSRAIYFFPDWTQPGNSSSDRDSEWSLRIFL